VKLIKAIKGGNEREFKQLYDAYHRRLYFFALKNAKNKEEAEDLTQSIFLKVWEKRTKLSDQIPF